MSAAGSQLLRAANRRQTEMFGHTEARAGTPYRLRGLGHHLFLCKLVKIISKHSTCRGLRDQKLKFPFPVPRWQLRPSHEYHYGWPTLSSESSSSSALCQLNCGVGLDGVIALTLTTHMWLLSPSPLTCDCSHPPHLQVRTYQVSADCCSAGMSVVVQRWFQQVQFFLLIALRPQCWINKVQKIHLWNFKLAKLTGVWAEFKDQK